MTNKRTNQNKLKNADRPDRRLVLARTCSESLAAIIRARGLTAHEVARLAGLDHCQIGRFLRGERDIRLSTLDRIASALELELVERTRARGKSWKAPAGPEPLGHLAAASTAAGCPEPDGPDGPGSEEDA